MNAAGGLTALGTTSTAAGGGATRSSGASGGLFAPAHGKLGRESEFAGTLLDSMAPGALSLALSPSTAAPAPGSSSQKQAEQTGQSRQTEPTRLTGQTREERPLLADFLGGAQASASRTPVAGTGSPANATGSRSGQPISSAPEISSAAEIASAPDPLPVRAELEGAPGSLRTAAKGGLSSKEVQLRARHTADAPPASLAALRLPSLDPLPELATSAPDLSAAAPILHRKEEETKPRGPVALAPVEAEGVPLAPPQTPAEVTAAPAPAARQWAAATAGAINPGAGAGRKGASFPQAELGDDARAALAGGLPGGLKETSSAAPVGGIVKNQSELSTAQSAGVGANPPQGEGRFGFGTHLSDKGNSVDRTAGTGNASGSETSGVALEDKTAAAEARFAAQTVESAALLPRADQASGAGSGERIGQSGDALASSAMVSLPGNDAGAPSELPATWPEAAGLQEELNPVGALQSGVSARAAAGAPAAAKLLPGSGSSAHSGLQATAGLSVTSGSMIAGQTLAPSSGEAVRSGPSSEAYGEGHGLGGFTALDMLTRMDSGAAAAPSTHLPGHSVAVGVDDPAHGWIEVRAEGMAGQVTASLAAASPEAHAALHAQLPAMAQYLAEHDVGVRSMAMSGGADHAAGNSLGGSGGGFGAGSGDGSAGQGGSGSSPGAPGNPSPGANAHEGRASGRGQAQTAGRSSEPSGAPGTAETGFGGGRLISVRA